VAARFSLIMTFVRRRFAHNVCRMKSCFTPRRCATSAMNATCLSVRDVLLCIKGARGTRRSIELFTRPNESGAGLLQPRLKPPSNPGEAHWQPVNLKLAICVLQLKVPLDFKYSLV
jgi:hypothetical protein